MNYFKFSLIPLMIILFTSVSYSQRFNKTLQSYIDGLPDEFSMIPAERQARLKEISDLIFREWQANKDVQPLFICTHNSRRSLMAQIWMTTASYYYGVNRINAYSGGTEATAFNKRAVDALRRAGFSVFKDEENPSNPVYIFLSGKRYLPIMGYSKKYDDTANPHDGFFAVMVCSDADASCPMVPGADQRFSLPYDDPRYSDNTASEVKTYDDRCRQIAREMFYLMDEVKKAIMISQEKRRK